MNDFVIHANLTNSFHVYIRQTDTFYSHFQSCPDMSTSSDILLLNKRLTGNTIVKLDKTQYFMEQAPSTFVNLVSLLVPIKIYGCEIWGFSNVQVIERLHLNYEKCC